MIRWLLVLVVILALVCAGAYVAAGRGAPPHLTINKPDRFIGQTGSVDVVAEAPNSRFTTLTITLEQNGKRVPLADLRASDTGAIPAGDALVEVTQVGRHQLRISRP